VALGGDVRLSARRRAATTKRRPEHNASGWRWAVLWWLPVPCAATYGAAVLVNFHDVITSAYVNSDAAVARVLGESIGSIPGGSYVTLGNHSWYEEWLFLLATHGLPAHQNLWRVAPGLWSLFGVGALVWTIRRVLDAWSAALCGAALLCVGAFGRFCFLTLDWHSLGLVHTILVVAVAVWVAQRVHSSSWRLVIAVAFALGMLSAFPLASDGLFQFWALAPLAAATGLVAWRSRPRVRWRLVAFTATVVSVAAVGASVLASIMHQSGIAVRVWPVGFVALRQLGEKLELMAQSYAYLGGGRFLAPSEPGKDLVVLLSATLVLLALLAVLDQARRLLARRSPREQMTDARLLYVAYWTISLILTSLVFLLSNAPRDSLSGRYLLAGYVAIAALLPLVAMRSLRARAAVTVGVCIFALTATFQLVRRPFDVIKAPEANITFPGPATAIKLARFAREERVGYGYAGYWDAEQLTLATDFRVLIRPVRVCRSRSYALCYPQLGMISSWYTPRPRRTLLLVDAVGTSYNGVLGPDPALGKALTSRRLGDLTVYVYPYDVGSRISKPRCGFTWAHPC
jgi:hypothetical protein